MSEAYAGLRYIISYVDTFLHQILQYEGSNIGLCICTPVASTQFEICVWLNEASALKRRQSFIKVFAVSVGWFALELVICWLSFATLYIGACLSVPPSSQEAPTCFDGWCCHHTNALEHVAPHRRVE